MCFRRRQQCAKKLSKRKSRFYSEVNSLTIASQIFMNLQTFHSEMSARQDGSRKFDQQMRCSELAKATPVNSQCGQNKGVSPLTTKGKVPQKEDPTETVSGDSVQHAVSVDPLICPARKTCCWFCLTSHRDLLFSRLHCSCTEENLPFTFPKLCSRKHSAVPPSPCQPSVSAHTLTAGAAGGSSSHE